MWRKYPLHFLARPGANVSVVQFKRTSEQFCGIGAVLAVIIPPLPGALVR
jgi:hypothetical protein